MIFKKKRSLLRISCFFCPNLGDLKKKKKKNGLQPGSDPLFLVVITLGPWPLFIANTIGEEAIFVFRAKIGLRNAKNGVNAKNRPMGGWSPPRPPPGYATGNARGQRHRRKCLQNNIYIYIFLRRSPKKGLQKFFSDDLQKRTQKRSSKIFREVSGVLQHNFNGAKNSAVFLRTGGFEAKAKAKAKDFKMCPRGQRRPRELHLCLEYKSNLLLYSL